MGRWQKFDLAATPREFVEQEHLVDARCAPDDRAR
jgi:hypothetical protein